MDPFLLGYADAWATREHGVRDELRPRYDKGYNEALADIKRASLFTRGEVQTKYQHYKRPEDS